MKMMSEHWFIARWARFLCRECERNPENSGHCRAAGWGGGPALTRPGWPARAHAHIIGWHYITPVCHALFDDRRALGILLFYLESTVVAQIVSGQCCGSCARSDW